MRIVCLTKKRPAVISKTVFESNKIPLTHFNAVPLWLLFINKIPMGIDGHKKNVLMVKDLCKLAVSTDFMTYMAWKGT